MFNSNLESYTILNCKQVNASKTAQKQGLERSPFHFQNAYRYDKNQKVSITFLYIYRTNKRVLSIEIGAPYSREGHKINTTHSSAGEIEEIEEKGLFGFSGV